MFGKVHFKEIKHFSPDGKSMPNGIGFQRGAFLHECKKNKDAFEIDQSICMVHNAKRESLGGIIVFSTDAVADSLVCDYLQHITPPIAILLEMLSGDNMWEAVVNYTIRNR